MRRRCWCSGIPMTAGRPAGTGRDLSTAAAEVHAECWRCIEILFRRCLPRPWSDYLLGEEPLVTARRPVDMASALRRLLVARRFVLCLPPANQALREHHERHPG